MNSQTLKNVKKIVGNIIYYNDQTEIDISELMKTDHKNKIWTTIDNRKPKIVMLYRILSDDQTESVELIDLGNNMIPNESTYKVNDRIKQ